MTAQTSGRGGTPTYPQNVSNVAPPTQTQTHSQGTTPSYSLPNPSYPPQGPVSTYPPPGVGYPQGPPGYPPYSQQPPPSQLYNAPQPTPSSSSGYGAPSIAPPTGPAANAGTGAVPAQFANMPEEQKVFV